MNHNKRKPTFFTSDLHFYHSNIIKLSNRPFRDDDHMHRVLINNYNAAVPEDGICYFLGDMGLAKNSKFGELVSELNGTKILIMGNHDKGVNALYNMGFDVVLNSCSLIIAREFVTMSHYPLKGIYRENITGMKHAIDGDNWHGETKYGKYAINNEGQFHLHGHIHSPNSGKSERVCGRQFDVGVDANDFRPVSISVIESWITKTKESEK